MVEHSAAQGARWASSTWCRSRRNPGAALVRTAPHVTDFSLRHRQVGRCPRGLREAWAGQHPADLHRQGPHARLQLAVGRDEAGSVAAAIAATRRERCSGRHGFGANVSLERLQITSLCTTIIQQSAPSELLALSLANSIALYTTLRMKAVLQLAHTHLLTTKFELRHRWHC